MRKGETAEAVVHQLLLLLLLLKTESDTSANAFSALLWGSTRVSPRYKYEMCCRVCAGSELCWGLSLWRVSVMRILSALPYAVCLSPLTR